VSEGNKDREDAAWAALRATDNATLADVFKIVEGIPRRPFKPVAHYNKEGNQIEVYLSNRDFLFISIRKPTRW